METILPAVVSLAHWTLLEVQPDMLQDLQQWYPGVDTIAALETLLRASLMKVN